MTSATAVEQPIPVLDTAPIYNSIKDPDARKAVEALASSLRRIQEWAREVKTILDKMNGV